MDPLAYNQKELNSELLTDVDFILDQRVIYDIFNLFTGTKLRIFHNRKIYQAKVEEPYFTSRVSKHVCIINNNNYISLKKRYNILQVNWGKFM